ncbi:hypothetical protein HMPREF0908_1966 [Selenomonas flueggei ATCC 43531]|uniref:Uncharacterized protein n=1 Tax=Selenomonas flueggei ATCC 43531 TaxID=638302 RepID=C4V666_9FIRM|nr:hypothetical protein HMPREF0908_1966 [Selenomonas flueggei ATCC 43531]
MKKYSWSSPVLSFYSLSMECIFLSVLSFYRFLEENARSKGT